jgi:hypothetical protein
MYQLASRGVGLRYRYGTNQYVDKSAVDPASTSPVGLRCSEMMVTDDLGAFAHPHRPASSVSVAAARPCFGSPVPRPPVPAFHAGLRCGGSVITGMPIAATHTGSSETGFRCRYDSQQMTIRAHLTGPTRPVSVAAWTTTTKATRSASPSPVQRGRSPFQCDLRRDERRRSSQHRPPWPVSVAALGVDQVLAVPCEPAPNSSIRSPLWRVSPNRVAHDCVFRTGLQAGLRCSIDEIEEGEIYMAAFTGSSRPVSVAATKTSLAVPPTSPRADLPGRSPLQI